MTRVLRQVLPALLLAVATASAADAPSAVDAPPAADAAPVADAAPGADSHWPTLVGAQYTYVLQHQGNVHSPYRGPLSLRPDGDTEASHTIGFYAGWALTDWAQYYFDTEKFMGAGVSGATGLGGLTNGDVVREGANDLAKRFYVARNFLRLMLPLGAGTTRVARAQDQVAGFDAATRLELKAGLMAVNDDFDRNRYAGSTRTQFMNWSLWNDTAWDFAANTRGYTHGYVLAYVSPAWTLRFGEYLMPKFANGQPLEPSWVRAHGDNLELTLSPWSSGAVLRVLAYRNRGHFGDYREALAAAAAAGTGAPPDIIASEAAGRTKSGFALNAEQPLADGGDSGLFARLGWNDGRTESYVFTEVDRTLSVGGQLSGVHWARADDRLGVALAIDGLSPAHRAYLAAGGAGFLLDDGRLNYGTEQILECYYRLQLSLPAPLTSLRVQLSPDIQYIRNPGYNRDRGPAGFVGLRFHVEY